MNKPSLVRRVAVIGLSAACCFAVAGCGANNYGYTGGVAATVNGTEIQEDTITKYIQDYRTSMDLSSDDDWGETLATYGMTAETLRSQVIDMYVEQELVNQACSEHGISVDSSEVDSYVEKMKANFSSDDAWKSALESYGLTEDSYRSEIESSLKEQKLEDAVITDTAVTDEQKNTWVSTYYSYLNGAKRSSHILFSASDEATANEVLTKINNGEISFEDAAKQYSTDTSSATNGGDVGWDIISSFVDEYQTALDDLSEGQVSGLVTSTYGIHIIKCTDVLSADANTTFAQLPEAIQSYAASYLESDAKSEAYDTWMDNYKSQADIVINDMPEKVPYNVDISQYSSLTSTSTTTSTTNNSSSN